MILASVVSRLSRQCRTAGMMADASSPVQQLQCSIMAPTTHNHVQEHSKFNALSLTVATASFCKCSSVWELPARSKLVCGERPEQPQHQQQQQHDQLQQRHTLYEQHG